MALAVALPKCLPLPVNSLTARQLSGRAEWRLILSPSILPLYFQESPVPACRGSVAKVLPLLLFIQRATPFLSISSVFQTYRELAFDCCGGPFCLPLCSAFWVKFGL